MVWELIVNIFPLLSLPETGGEDSGHSSIIAMWLELIHIHTMQSLSLHFYILFVQQLRLYMMRFEILDMLAAYF